MTTAKEDPSRTLTQGDLERVAEIVYKTGDDIAISIARSFERLEERMDSMEARLYSRISELEDHLQAIRTDGDERKASLSLA